VRDLYALPGDRMLMVATDRISAFDVVMPQGIPRKGEVLTRLSAYWFDRTAAVVPNHMVAVLEASTGVLADQDAYLSALAAAVRIDVAMRELSLVDDATVDAGAMSTGGMAGRATAPATARPSSTGAGAAPLDATPVSTSAGMGGM